ncbi:MAG: glucose-1-phosphate thymidylyltransferase [Chitinophagaceae bacterium]|nr:MAG: glucose-1-phosphate thymidylyltransferase [Chitinophagaceae bacterium]
MAVVLFDQHIRAALFPFTETRHTALIRVGVFTIKEKWERLLKVPVRISENANDLQAGEIAIPANVLPAQEDYLQIIGTYKTGSELSSEIRTIQRPWDIFIHNAWAIKSDAYIIMNEKRSAPVSSTNKCVNERAIFLEEGVVMEHCIINATEGAVYIGKNALVMEGTMIRGPVSIGENAVVKMGAKLYGGTTIGPHCNAGGEIKNSVLMEYSNKSHDGYLGDSVIGAWCNLGAGTSNSNMKNNAGDVSYLFDKEETPMVAGSKAGVLMGDYSRCAINTSFNTGTIVGVCCNIFGGMPPKYMPHFSWGTERYIFDKAIADIINWKKMKAGEVTDDEIDMLYELYSNKQ